jgi:D-xylose 1-dehydrogenase (NADP+, D-xylono-1,5-lactone-forming)
MGGGVQAGVSVGRYDDGDEQEDLMSGKRLAWGILGTGRIAGQFAAGLQASERCRLAAVGSRRVETGREFAARFGIAAVHGSYEALLADEAVEAVYVSLPNGLHHEWTVRALRTGKHVLCEKPLAGNLAQAQEMFATARQSGRVLVEAFMYRSHPLTHAVVQAVREGRIGELRTIRTSFLFATEKVEGNIKFNPALAGGSLMDVGCYCLSYARLFAGAEPKAMLACGHLHASGVDDYAAGALAFPGGVVSSFACGMTVRADNTAHLEGTAGYILVPLPWKPPATEASYTLVDKDGGRHPALVSANKHLYALEADDFAATVLEGAPVRVTEADSLGNQRCLDELRRQVGVAF